jgi:hypothetical protein
VLPARATPPPSTTAEEVLCSCGRYGCLDIAVSAAGRLGGVQGAARLILDHLFEYELVPAAEASLRSSSEADTGELGPLGHQATRHIPDEARLVDSPGVDELRTLQHADRARDRQGTHVDG